MSKLIIFNGLNKYLTSILNKKDHTRQCKNKFWAIKSKHLGLKSINYGKLFNSQVTLKKFQESQVREINFFLKHQKINKMLQKNRLSKKMHILSNFRK